jgi:hypothetical protein
LYSTPRFYADNTVAHPTLTDFNQTGIWGLLGEGANPTSLTAVTNFVNMIMTRYNSPTGAWRVANPTLGKGIQYFEVWNEPKFNNTNVSQFWWGTASQFVDLTKTVYDAVKAVDTSCIVTSAGFDNFTSINTFLSTTGSLLTSGYNACDWIAIHEYGYSSQGGISLAGLTSDVRYGSVGVSMISDIIKSYGNSKSIVVTEMGVDATAGATSTAFYAASNLFKYTYYARLLMTYAALGVKAWHAWHWGATGNIGNSGDWQLDTILQQVYNDSSVRLPGRTVLPSSNFDNVTGVVTLNFSDKSSWIV